MPASADPNCDDDDEFINIHELLFGMQQKSVPASADKTMVRWLKALTMEPEVAVLLILAAPW
jgi:hypothetical protein